MTSAPSPNRRARVEFISQGTPYTQLGAKIKRHKAGSGAPWVDGTRPPDSDIGDKIAKVLARTPQGGAVAAVLRPGLAASQRVLSASHFPASGAARRSFWNPARFMQVGTALLEKLG